MLQQCPGRLALATTGQLQCLFDLLVQLAVLLQFVHRFTAPSWRNALQRALRVSPGLALRRQQRIGKQRVGVVGVTLLEVVHQRSRCLGLAAVQQCPGQGKAYPRVLRIVGQGFLVGGLCGR
ncbi:hypothetical protein D3C76_1368660 [compost metagenome]